MLTRIRKLMSICLMALGIVMLSRGMQYCILQRLGWEGAIQTLIAGGLVFALGIARWRCLRQR